MIHSFLYLLCTVGKSADSNIEELRNISLEESGSVQTDFTTGADCYQKVVRFCRDGSKLVTGGVEGVVRVWRVSQCVCVCTPCEREGKSPSTMVPFCGRGEEGIQIWNLEYAYTVPVGILITLLTVRYQL